MSIDRNMRLHGSATLGHDVGISAGELIDAIVAEVLPQAVAQVLGELRGLMKPRDAAAARPTKPAG